ncbi:MAG: hypothetical protein WA902_08995 [Thermosynechococcaceae cyanobacterium]
MPLFGDSSRLDHQNAPLSWDDCGGVHDIEPLALASLRRRHTCGLLGCILKR